MAKFKQLLVTLAVAAGAMMIPQAAMAVDDGDIYSIKLIDDVKYGGRIPDEANPLRIGEKVVIRVRLLNRDYNSGLAQKPWRFVPQVASLTEAQLAALFSPNLGLKLGDQSVYAKYVETVDNTSAGNPLDMFTDLIFSYTAKSGDLAIPAQLMTTDGKAAGSAISKDYELQNMNYWQLSNNDNAVANFHFRAEGAPSVTAPETDEPHRNITGTGMGLFVKTVDFDNNYAEVSDVPGIDSIWRVITEGEIDSAPQPPAIQVDGMVQSAVTMYVWSDDINIVSPRTTDGATEVVQTIDGVEYRRWVLPVSMGVGAVSKSFNLRAMPGQEGNTVKIKMSSSPLLASDDMGKLVNTWVERTVKVGPPPTPYVSFDFVDPAGNPVSQVSCSTDYRQYVAALRIRLNGKVPTAPVNVTIAMDQDVCPDAEANRRIGISASSDPIDLPWADAVKNVTFNIGETEKMLYVYALDRTDDLATKIQFIPVSTSTEYPGAIRTAFLTVNGIKPAIVSPTSSDTIADAIAGEPYSFDVTVADSYRNMRTTGWRLKYKSTAFGDNNWKEISDVTVDRDTGTFTADLTFTQECENREMEIYVLDPDGVASEHVKIKVTAGAPKKAWGEVIDDPGDFAEGSYAKVKFFISQPDDGGKPLYAFLLPMEGTDAAECIGGSAIAAPGGRGVLIEAGSTDSGTRFAELEIKDGRHPKTQAAFEVVLCSSLTWDPAKVKSYARGQVYINAVNVMPQIVSCSIGGKDIDASGADAGSVAQGVTKKFKLSIGDTEPSIVDLNGELVGGVDNRYWTQWKFGNEDWSAPLYGNPNNTEISHTFHSPGEQLIKVRVQDKDMRAKGVWSQEFTFTVTVLDVPQIVITPKYGTVYDETSTGDNASHFDVTLTAPPAFAGDERLVVELNVECLGDASKYSPADCVLSTSTLEFRSGATLSRGFYLRTLDGTPESGASGFRITAKATAASQALDTEGKTWEYGEVEIQINNVKPEILTPVVPTDTEGKPIAQVTTVGTPMTLAWTLRDVAADRAGMTVVWTTSEGESATYRQGTGPGELADVMSGTHTFSFNSSGEKSITMMATDKDGAVETLTYYYRIEASKALEIVPHGPATGNGAPLGSRYHDKAKGLGAGKIWADNLARVRNWTSMYNCGLNSSWRIFGRGYANGETDTFTDDALGTVTYNYTDDLGRDSFLYAWLQIVQEKDSPKPTDQFLAVSPEHRGSANSGTLVGLPTEPLEDGGYVNTTVEAIFAKELLPSDNMGDINQDGIPDIYVKKYEFGVFAADGSMETDDLQPISVANGTGNLDEDFLPASVTAAYASLIPGLPESWVTMGVPFDAKMEIRGWHDGLNDAPAQAGINDVTPDRKYAAETAPGVWGWDETCTISELEQLAWQDYAAVHGLDWTSAADWKRWSPERPTDPCMNDTDDDGFDDGYEYFFWYRAHVGYMDNGVHKYMTGRAYDPRNPGEGKLIPSAVIEQLMDPLTAADAGSVTRDTDNDGLPDLLEFTIGTNPFDFDTDGDGLPDGFELMLAGTDPLLAQTTPGIPDAQRNFDGDAMAFSTAATEAVEVPPPSEIIVPYAFAVIDPEGDTDGVQWYSVETKPENLAVDDSVTVAGSTFTILDNPDVVYFTSAEIKLVDGRLAADLDKETTCTTTNALPEGVQSTVFDPALHVVRLMPVRIPAGTTIENVATVEAMDVTFDDAGVPGASTAWVYGTAAADGFGMLAIGRNGNAPGGQRLAALPAANENVAIMHYLVYQEFGFDPRTAWNPNAPLGARWKDHVANGIGAPARTRAYTLYDEFLLMSFFLNTGTLTVDDVTATPARPLATIWAQYTTDGRGPGESAASAEPTADGAETAAAPVAAHNGADTDRDGVPDGWELYVMSGPPDTNGDYFFVGPYESPFSPFVPDAAKPVTDAGADADELTELREFAGSDSCGYYREFSTTIVRPEEDKKWFNKFFPTDPYGTDTDGDGLADGAEGSAFNYGDVDTGTISVPGGGLNPCTVDTDSDGLPDGWERQFAGSQVYTGDGCQWATGVDADGNEVTSTTTTLQGYANGMDGTVWDAYNHPHKVQSDGETAETMVVSRNGVAQVVDRDYDHDGLENWQEYLVGTMRCWRWDDPFSRWDSIPSSAYYNDFGEFDITLAMAFTQTATPNDFWYVTLFDMTSPFYNPHLVTGHHPGSLYFSRVTNVWDVNYTEDGTYYVFSHRVNDTEYSELWGEFLKEKINVGGGPQSYVSCSPILADTDQDSMDDYYELFHGMNPLLGEIAGTGSRNSGVDVVADAWGQPLKYNAEMNWWTAGDEDELRARALYKIAEGGAPRGTLDFLVYPWMNGLVDADPDGDDIRNQDEGIMPFVAPKTTWHHTDPTPLWMTDSSYRDSLVSRFFRMPTKWGNSKIVMGVEPPEVVTDPDGNEYELKYCDGFKIVKDWPNLGTFAPDHWSHASMLSLNWIVSFEENEGFDTDHNGLGDYEELQGLNRGESDPLDVNSPARRQAMYFPGHNSALQSMPFSPEAYPIAGVNYPDDMSFIEYTVECWAMPEAGDGGKIADATVVERAVDMSPSHCADEQFIRCNFNLAVKGGKWYTKFDSNGTIAGNPVEVYGYETVETGKWYHVAATYNAKQLVLYVNGKAQGSVQSSLKPAYGSNAVVLHPLEPQELGATPHHYWYDRPYSAHAFIVGASFKTDVDVGHRIPGGSHLSLLSGGNGWDYYKDFFRGYVDEIRVWDGARSAEDILNDFSKRRRYTREDALANRNEVYGQWVNGNRRYEKTDDDVEVKPELRFHWTFNGVPAAENAKWLAPAPHGYNTSSKAVKSRPSEWRIGWWNLVLEQHGSAYAGNGDWVTWVPNTVTHLPRFDGSTLDSFYWHEDFAGDVAGRYEFARTAEPASRWTQYTRSGAEARVDFVTSGRGFWRANNNGTNGVSSVDKMFEFTGRHLNTLGDDLLPIGGAFVKYVDKMWDEQGASTMWEYTGADADSDGLPDWWQIYAEQNYRPADLDPHLDIGRTTPVDYTIGGVAVRIPAWEAYLRDLAKGVYVDATGKVHPTGTDRAQGVDKTDYAQTAMTDGLIPDWWKSLYKIDRHEPLADSDNDGLNNYVEYVASELLPFKLRFSPVIPRSDAETLDYFRKVGKLYVGEMLTDYDQMEDHWERKQNDTAIADPARWDALRDHDEDGWTNFDENRYNGFKQSTLARLVSHIVGDTEVLDAPTPSLKLTVRYNGSNFAAASSGGSSASGNSSSSASGGSGNSAPKLVVQTRSRGDGFPVDAKFSVEIGARSEREVYLGGWENRVVNGTMTPGHIDISTLRIFQAKLTTSEILTWSVYRYWYDSVYIYPRSGSYAEYLNDVYKYGSSYVELDKINFTWTEFNGDDAGNSVTIRGNAEKQTAEVLVGSEKVSAIDLLSGDFSFDLGKLVAALPADSSTTSTVNVKSSVFKIVYESQLPTLQQNKYQVSLAKADEGFVRGGRNTIEAFLDNDGNGVYTPGEPYGVLTDVEVGWAGRKLELELTDTSAITPRVDLWDGSSDRVALTQYTGQQGSSNHMTFVDSAPAAKCRVRVMRHRFNGFNLEKAGLADNYLVWEGEFNQQSKSLLTEADFLRDGAIDLDWENLRGDAVKYGTYRGVGGVTNATYAIVFDQATGTSGNNYGLEAFHLAIERRFEGVRTRPTPCPDRSVFTRAQPTFAWRIDGEEAYASQFGTSYTGFRVRVRDLDGKEIYNSGVRRLPARDMSGVYSWTAPVYAGEGEFKNLANYVWDVALYNAKFADDALMSISTSGPKNVDDAGKGPFSDPLQFRMNVTTLDTSSQAIRLNVAYAGPATQLAGRIRVQAYETPDFTGDPVASATVGETSATVKLAGLQPGSYYVCAYIDTNGNGKRDGWESWGYLNGRDVATGADIFNPVAIEAEYNPPVDGLRTVHIEDCDTDGDFFPDVWEAEMNGGEFVPFMTGEGQGPVTGDAELIGVNTNLVGNLAATPSLRSLSAVRALLSTPAGVSLMTGVSPAKLSAAPSGAVAVTPEVKPETLRICGLKLDAAAGKVSLKVGAEMDGEIDEAMAGFLSVTVNSGAEVTVRVLHSETIGGEWREVAAEKVVISRSGSELEVKLGDELPASGFFRTEIVQ